MRMSNKQYKRWLQSIILILFICTFDNSNHTAKAHVFTNLIRDWKQFSSYPSLARALRALNQGRYSDAEREAQYVLNQINSDSRQARLLLAEALLAQHRYADALDALKPIINEPLYRQIQLIWLNQSEKKEIFLLF